MHSDAGLGFVSHIVPCDPRVSHMSGLVEVYYSLQDVREFGTGYYITGEHNRLLFLYETF